MLATYLDIFERNAVLLVLMAMQCVVKFYKITWIVRVL